MRRWADRLYRHRGSALIIILLLTFFFAWQARSLVVATHSRDLYPKGHAHTKLLEKYAQFGSPLSVVLVVQVKAGTIYNPETLSKIQQATREIDLLPGVDHNQIFSIASPRIRHLEATSAGIQSTPLLTGAVPRDARELEMLRLKISASPQAIGTLVSPQEDAAMIQAVFVERLTDYRAIFQGVNELVQRLKDDHHEVYAAGTPILNGWVDFYKRETLAIAAATYGVMVFVLAFQTRTLMAVLIPVLVAAITAVWGLGIAAFLRLNLDPLVIVLPMLLIARSFSHAIQACERYWETYAETRDRNTACIDSMVSLFPPGILGILTDAAGLIVIAVAPIPLLQKVAIVSAFWALSLIPAAVILTPLVLSFSRPPRFKETTTAGPIRARSRFTFGFLDRALQSTLHLSQGKRAWSTALVLVLVFAAAAIVGLRVRLGDDHAGTSLLWPDSNYNAAVARINERFAGFDQLQVVLESRDPKMSVHSPPALQLMQRFQRHMELHPEVGGTASFADLVTATHRLLHNGLPKWGIVPEDPGDAAMISQLALSGAGPGDADVWFTRDLSAASITVWYKDHRHETVEQALSHARAFHSAAPDGGAAQFDLRVGAGSFGLIGAINQTVQRAQTRIWLLAVTAIFVMCSLTYRSFPAGILLLVPVNFSNVLAIALMTCLDIGMDVNTLPVLAVGTGIGIDYAIYLTSRIREEFGRCNDYRRALTSALETTGRAIFLTGSALVAGMIPWYLLSSLRFQANMGLLIGFLMITNMVAALIIVPLLVTAVKPKFIARGTPTTRR